MMLDFENLIEFYFFIIRLSDFFVSDKEIVPKADNKKRESVDSLFKLI